MPQNKIIPVPTAEAEELKRNLLAWLNNYDGLPCRIKYEFLNPDAISMVMSTVQAPNKLRRYITGGYLGQYQFRLILRTQSLTDDERLSADEMLETMAKYIESADAPELDPNIKNVSFESTGAAIVSAFEDGSYDHALTFNMTYEVI